MKIRRRARIIALQALFEIDSVHHPVEQVLAQRLMEEPLSEEGKAFATRLVNGVLANLVRLDQVISEIADEWPLEQIAIVDRNILRLAIYEIMMDSDAPIKVAINEAVELAKLFGSDSSQRFVNGVLGTLVSRSDLSGRAKAGTA